MLDVAGLDLFGETEGANLTWSGVVESLPREGMLEASTWERAGWDLDTVWYPPPQDAPPTLR